MKTSQYEEKDRLFVYPISNYQVLKLQPKNPEIDFIVVQIAKLVLPPNEPTVIYWIFTVHEIRTLRQRVLPKIERPINKMQWNSTRCVTSKVKTKKKKEPVCVTYTLGISIVSREPAVVWTIDETANNIEPCCILEYTMQTNDPAKFHTLEIVYIMNSYSIAQGYRKASNTLFGRKNIPKKTNSRKNFIIAIE